MTPPASILTCIVCLFSLFRYYSYDVHLLQACHVYLSVIKEQSSFVITSNQHFDDVYACLETNLASHARLVRLLTLKILTTFEQVDMDTNEVCAVFENDVSLV